MESAASDHGRAEESDYFGIGPFENVDDAQKHRSEGRTMQTPSPDRPAASSPEFGTSGTEKSERTAFLQDNADKSQAFPQSAARDRHYVHVRVPLLVQRVLERLHVKTSTVYMTFESFERSLR